MKDNEIFEFLDSDRLIQENIDKIVGLEVYEAKRFEALYQRAINELREEVTREKSGTLNEARRNVVLSQLETALFALKMKSRKRAITKANAFARFANNDTVEELNYLDKQFDGILVPVPHDVIRVAPRELGFIIDRFSSDLNVVNEELKGHSGARV